MSEIKAPGLDAARLALARVATDTQSSLADAFAGRRPEPIDRTIPDAYLLLLAAVEVADGLAEKNARLREALAALCNASDAIATDKIGTGDGFAYGVGAEFVDALGESAANARRVLAEVTCGQ